MPSHDTELLSRMPLFKDVDLWSVRPLLERCDEVEHQTGAVLISPATANQHVYLLLKGRLTVHLTPDQPPLATLERGECVGEMSLFGSEAASAFVICAEPSRVLIIDDTTFWDLINASHEIAINLLTILSRRVRSGNQSIGEKEERATVDALTGLRNRRWLDETFAREVARAEAQRVPLCVAMADVDRFKGFNDTHGHAAGDVVLRTVAKVLRDSSRPKDLVARFGGEEFTVLFPDTPVDDAEAACERLRQAIGASECAHEGKPLPRVTASFGVAQRRPGEALAELIKRADDALYQAKEGGRDRVCVAP
jgi:diguanylate cyclase (GGDEF)-like protein